MAQLRNVSILVLSLASIFALSGTGFADSQLLEADNEMTLEEADARREMEQDEDLEADHGNKPPEEDLKADRGNRPTSGTPLEDDQSATKGNKKTSGNPLKEDLSAERGDGPTSGTLPEEDLEADRGDGDN